MTGKQFRYLRYEILKKQGKKLKYQDLEVKELEFEKKIAEKDNIEKFAKIVESNRGKELLMIAGTGTGKTYTVNKYMDELYAKEKGQHRIELIGVPSTAQARQLQKEGFHVLVENNSISDMDFLCKSYFRSKATGHSSMKIVFVYDKAETVRKFLKRHKNYQADLFVDEAHKLYTAYNYRKDALDIVELLIQEVKDRNGSIVLMTATPKALAFRESIGQAELVKADFDINQYLLPVMEDSNLLLQIYNDYVEDDMLKTITHTKEYKKIQRLIQIQDVVRGAEESKETKAKKAIESVCLGEKAAAEFKKELLGKLLKKIPDSEIKEMYQEKCYKGSLVKEKEVLEQEELMDMLHRLHTLLENLDVAVQKLKQSGGNVEEIKKYIRNNFDGYMNEMYLADREKLWGMDKVGRERTIILDNIYELNSSGNLKKKTINEKLLEQVVTALNEEFGTGAYTNTKVKNRIKKMFKLQDNGTKIYDVVRILR